MSATELDEFDGRGVLRLPGAIPAADAGAMRDRVWRHLGEAYGAVPEQPDTWPVTTPAHVQKLIVTGAFDAMATAGIRAAVDALPAARGWRPPPTWGRPLVTFPDPAIPAMRSSSTRGCCTRSPRTVSTHRG